VILVREPIDQIVCRAIAKGSDIRRRKATQSVQASVQVLLALPADLSRHGLDFPRGRSQQPDRFEHTQARVALTGRLAGFTGKSPLERRDAAALVPRELTQAKGRKEVRTKASLRTNAHRGDMRTGERAPEPA